MKERIEFEIKGRQRVARPYRYRESGLDNVFLASGVTIEDTPYGRMVTIENLNGLHNAIGLHIVEKALPMTGPELRFLRMQMGLTQKELAATMRISDQTVANYEKGKTSLGPADPLMRMIYLTYVVPEAPAGMLKSLADGASGRPPIRLPDAPRRKIVQRWHESLPLAA
jgi:transcriptional regulator with XRE-family HTH domain